jgi:hypothetical protein
MIVFVAGVILGIAIELLTGANVVMLVAILVWTLLIIGVWLFKECLLGTWWK